VTDIDGPALTITSLTLATGNGTLVDNGDGTWTYTPDADDDTSVTFNYTATDGSLTASSTASLDITPVNDAPTTAPVTLVAVAEDSGARIITQAELLANAADIDSGSLGATGLAIATGGGTLVDNGDGTWTYTPDANDDTGVTFSYTITDGSLTTAGSASLDITPVNDAPTTTAVTLAAIAEDSGARIITQAELLSNALDVDGDSLTATGLSISSGGGTLTDNGDGTWTYTPAADDDTSVSFSYTISDGSLTVAGSASLDITPVNDAPTASPVILAAIAEDSGARIITSAELLAGVADVDGPALTITSLSIASGNGTLVDNGDGTWTYTPATDDDTDVTFNYTASDGSLTASSTASLDITPVNDAPATTPVTLAAIAEDSGARLITQAELLANASDAEGDSLTATGLLISSGSGTLTDNGDGTWTYTPAANDDSSVSFSYTINDGNGGSVAGSASLDITPVNDAPSAAEVTLAAIAEDSGPRIITSAELLAGVTDIDGPALTITSLTLATGNGTLVDNGDGTWTYTPDVNDDTEVQFAYNVSDGEFVSGANVSLDITPVDDAAIANDDAFTVAENAVLGAGLNVFDDNGSGADSDIDNALAVTAVNGVAVDVGTPITLSSGALLTLNADGTFSYDTNGAFNGLAAAGSGASNISATETFTYTLNGGDTATVTITVTGVDSDDDALGTGSDDSINAGIGNDTVTALAGNDTIIGGLDADQLLGGEGDDVFVFNLGDGAAGEVVDGDNGTDRIAVESQADVRYATLTSIEAIDFASSAGAKSAVLAAAQIGAGLAAGATITGGVQADTLRVDLLTSLTADLSALVFQTWSANDIVRIYGDGDAEIIVGSLQRDAVYAGDGNDTLTGGGGGDVLHGGLGDDLYIVDAANEAREGLNEGTDTVQSSVNYALGANLEHLTLTGTANLSGTGNNLDNILTGNNGNNRLTGFGGADTMQGGDGNDVYIAALADTLIELFDEGIDTVRATQSFTLGDNFENLILDGTANAHATGNELDNRLTGNSGDNVLTGGLGRDVVAGGAGADRFDFNDLAESGTTLTTRDVVTDFDAGTGATTVDQLDLATIDANDGLIGNQAFIFGGPFTAGHVRVIQSGADILVQLNTDADAMAEMSIRLVNVSTANLDTGDFIL
jgi:VCBS repeat-containing protein